MELLFLTLSPIDLAGRIDYRGLKGKGSILNAEFITLLHALILPM